ncbi:MAG: hypothetical protein GX893_01680 [Firmicutes bacterium]|mgnify:CR=1 FL=1|nr:hypothetical protein [Bacillota bacterium]
MRTSDIVKIAAFVPIYENNLGQCIKIFFRNGQTGLVDLSMRSFLKNAAKAFSLDLQEMRRRLAALTGQKNLLPLALSPFLLYIPLKCRKPIVKGDGAYGYFRLRSLLTAAADPPPCTLTLEGGHQLTICQSYRIVRQRLRMARKVEGFLLEEFYNSFRKGQA